LVQGLVEEINGMTTINNPSSVVILSSGNPVPDALTLPPELISQEQYEAVLARIVNVDITDVNIGEGEWTVTSGLNHAVIDNIYSYSYVPSIGEHIDWVQGPVMEFSGDFKLQPRDNNDISATFVPIPTTGFIGLLILITGFGLLLFHKHKH
ncbi:hypothetical protein K8T06_06495, partial [bacterium]|nr:hypothetical protein [bacterium]